MPLSKVAQEMVDHVDFDTIKKMALVSCEGTHFTLDNIRKDVIEKYIEEWAKAKSHFYVAFGNKFRVTKSVRRKMDRHGMESLIQRLAQDFPKYSLLINSFYIDDYIENKIAGQPVWLSELLGSQKGKKLSKVISSVVCDPVFDIELSKILQNKFVDTQVTLSCDIMDYLTTSINKHKWFSCYNVMSGCFGNGPWSIMQDKCTLVGYSGDEISVEYSKEVGGQTITFSANNKQSRSHVLCAENNFAICSAQGSPDTWFYDAIYELTRQYVYKGKSIFREEDYYPKYKESFYTHISDDIRGSYIWVEEGKDAECYVIGVPKLNNVINGERVQSRRGMEK